MFGISEFHRVQQLFAQLVVWLFIEVSAEKVKYKVLQVVFAYLVNPIFGYILRPPPPPPSAQVSEIRVVLCRGDDVIWNHQCDNNYLK